MESLARAQGVMAQAQATMDAKARGEHVPMEQGPLTVVFRGGGSDWGGDSDPTPPAADARVGTGDANAGSAGQTQQALPQQLQNIQQVANTLQQKQNPPIDTPIVNTSSSARKSTLCQHTKPGQACLAQ